LDEEEAVDMEVAREAEAIEVAVRRVCGLGGVMVVETRGEEDAEVLVSDTTGLGDEDDVVEAEEPLLSSAEPVEAQIPMVLYRRVREETKERERVREEKKFGFLEECKAQNVVKISGVKPQHNKQSYQTLASSLRTGLR
jgi:hypothetical protein